MASGGREGRKERMLIGRGDSGREREYKVRDRMGAKNTWGERMEQKETAISR